MSHYLIFGDSIAYGEGVLQGCWVQLLRESLKPHDCVFNLGVDGETTQGLLIRLEAEIKPRLSDESENFIIIALGVNDTALVPLEKYQQNLLQLIKLARKYTEKIILIGPVPVDQVKVDPIPWSPEMSYKTDLVKQYSEAMGKIAVAKKLKFVDLFNQLPSEYIQTLDDGVHPNTAGHRMIFDIIKTNL